MTKLQPGQSVTHETAELARALKPKGKPLAKCAKCGSTDIGWCSLHGGWWCDKGHNAEDLAAFVHRVHTPRKRNP
jgi:hypothetical protein